MADWAFWGWAAGITVVLELLTGTFYLLMVAIGLAAGAMTAAAGGGWPAQTLVAGIVGVLATGLLWRGKAGGPPAVEAAADPNVNIDIGQSVNVPAWQDGTARVMYRGALWDVELAAGCAPVGGTYTIREVRGSRLIVGA